ncbi:MAG: ATP-dependent helicase, partial [Acidobacteriota bacterium]|nr:ATP-dependent helicase [Acidobacteriota bacterium]
MQMPEMLDNVSKTVKDDLTATINKGDKLSIAAAYFSIYAYQALKKQLDGIAELRFIFTSPTFLQEETSKAKREFYIPRLGRERSLYGVKTKVLMLSATPVNNRFADLRHQLELAYEGNPNLINGRLGTKRSIDDIFRNAQKAFNQWSKRDENERTTDALLKSLDFDFFEVLDSVTIARSRKHLEKYYNMN